jgi:hypothetical protein
VQYGGGSALGGLAGASAQMAGSGLGKAMASSMFMA